MHKPRPDTLMAGRDGQALSRSRRGVFMFISATTVSIILICLYLHNLSLTQLEHPTAPTPCPQASAPTSPDPVKVLPGPIQVPPAPVKAYLTAEEMGRLPSLCPLPDHFGAQIPACHELGFPLATRGDIRAVLSRVAGPGGEIVLNIMSLDESDPSSHEYHLSWLRSWLWHLHRIGLTNYLLIGLGRGSCGPVRHMGARCFDSPPGVEAWMERRFLEMTHSAPEGSNAHRFSFLSQSNPPRIYEAIKWFYMARITSEGHSVIYADQDVHFLRDPRPHWPPGWDVMGLSDYFPFGLQRNPPLLPPPLPSLVPLDQCMAQRGIHDPSVDSICQSTGLVFVRGNPRTAAFLVRFWDSLMAIEHHPNEQFAFNRFVSAYLRAAPKDQLCRLYRDGYGTNASCAGSSNTQGRAVHDHAGLQRDVHQHAGASSHGHGSLHNRHLLKSVLQHPHGVKVGGHPPQWGHQGEEIRMVGAEDPITAELKSNPSAHGSSHSRGAVLPGGGAGGEVIGWEGRVPDVSPDLVRYTQLDPFLFINEPLVDWLDLRRSLASQLGPQGVARVAQEAGGSTHGAAAVGLYATDRVPDACFHCRCDPQGTPKYSGIVAVHMGYVFGKRKGPTMHRMGLWHGQHQAECEGMMAAGLGA
eukprot:jgi/Mesvir1/27641/Mv07371-RA.1